MILYIIAILGGIMFIMFLALIWAELGVNAYIELPPHKQSDVKAWLVFAIGLICLYFFV